MAQHPLKGSVVRSAALVAVFLVVAAAGAGVQRGLAAPSSKFYSTALSGPVAAGATFTAQIALTNSTSSSQSVGSENVVLPLGYSATTTGSSVTAPAGRNWKPLALGSLALADGTHQVVQLRAASNGDAITPGQTVTANISVSVPCSLPTDTTWKTEAKQSNDFSGPPGNDFLAVAGTYLSYNGTTHLYSLAFPAAAGSCGFRFVDPASNASTLPAWVPAAAGYNAGSGFSVEVEAIDSQGNRRSSFAGSATIGGLSTSPNGTAPLYGAGDTGSHVVSFTGGLASFTVTAADAEQARSLTAADTSSSSVTGTSASFDVWPGTPAALTMGHVADTTVALAISPAITVDVYDAYGNLESCATCTQPSISLTLATDAGGGTTLGGNGATSSVAGTATFSTVTLDRSGTGFTLQASSTTPAITSAASNAFTVYDNLCSGQTNPNGYVTCSASKNGTSITTDYGTATTDPTLFQLSAPGQNLPCGSLTTARGALVTFSPANKDTHGSAYTYRNPIAVTLRWDKSLVPGTGVTNFTLCLAKPFDDTANGWVANQYRAVQDCPAKLSATTKLPCAAKRSRNNAGDLVIVLLTATGDPIAGLG